MLGNGATESRRRGLPSDFVQGTVAVQLYRTARELRLQLQARSARRRRLLAPSSLDVRIQSCLFMSRPQIRPCGFEQVVDLIALRSRAPLSTDGTVEPPSMCLFVTLPAQRDELAIRLVVICAVTEVVHVISPLAAMTALVVVSLQNLAPSGLPHRSPVVGTLPSSPLGRRSPALDGFVPAHKESAAGRGNGQYPVRRTP